MSDVVIPHGDKTVKLSVDFFTDNIAAGDKTRQCHAWTVGAVNVPANKGHGIKSGVSVQFNSLPELGSAIERALAQAGVTLHEKTKKTAA